MFCKVLHYLLLWFYLLLEVTAHRCFMKRCLSCTEEMIADVGVSVECRPDNWVSAEWIHNLGHPPPDTSSKYLLEYNCIKMIATPDDKTWTRTTDLIRGCVPKVQVDSVCAGLVSIERARGHSDARCFVCSQNDCNGGQHNLKILNINVILAIAAFSTFIH